MNTSHRDSGVKSFPSQIEGSKFAPTSLQILGFGVLGVLRSAETGGDLMNEVMGKIFCCFNYGPWNGGLLFWHM